MIVPVEHPVAGHTELPGIPIKLSETPGSVRTPAPLLGANTDEILTNLLGFSENKIKELKQNDIF
jgi:CoA:oxalate CoA-transferase